MEQVQIPRQFVGANEDGRNSGTRTKTGFVGGNCFEERTAYDN